MKLKGCKKGFLHFSHVTMVNHNLKPIQFMELLKIIVGVLCIITLIYWTLYFNQNQIHLLLRGIVLIRCQLTPFSRIAPIFCSSVLLCWLVEFFWDTQNDCRVMLISFSPLILGFWNVWTITVLGGWNRVEINHQSKERRGERL